MANHEAYYSTAKRLIQSGEISFTEAPIQLKSGEIPKYITPYTIVETTVKDSRSLFLYYLDYNLNADRIDLREIPGFEVIEGEGEYSGKLLIRFFYYKQAENGQEGQIEKKPRTVLPTAICFGVHGSHKGEYDNFYLVGEDTKYIDRPKEARVRNFPFWRTVGLFSDNPKDLQAMFMPQNKTS